MNLKKIIAAVAATAVAVTTMAVSAFASTVKLDSSYAGDWGKSASIPKTAFDEFSGDVKVVLTVEAVNVADGASYILKPMDVDKSWDAITFSLKNAKGSRATAKPDGFMQITKDQTELAFIVPAAVAQDLWNNGIAFQTNNVIVKSATLSDGTGLATTDFTIVSDDDTTAYCAGTFDPWNGKTVEEEEAEAAPAAEEAAPADEEVAPAEEAAPAEEVVADVDDDEDVIDVADDEDDVDLVADVDDDDEDVAVDTAESASDDTAADTAVADTATAPAADSTTTAAKTGNTAAAVVLSIAAVAGAAAVVAKKRK
jgi:hypothetical protein